MDKRICYFAVTEPSSDYDSEDTVCVHGYSSDVSMCKFFSEVSQVICFGDCSDEDVIEIVWQGQRVHYCGWEPGMVYRYVDEKNKEVWCGRFPEWDH